MSEKSIQGKPDFRLEAESIKEEIVGLRRAIHEYPEMGTEEEQTAVIIEKYLDQLGISNRRSFNTGVIGLLDSGNPGSTVAFRADMDALKIQEKTAKPYASKRPGLMHACGHDAHVAALLGAAKLLANHKSELKGSVKFLFQPDEEGDGGAKHMIDDGAMENPKVEAVFGAHVDPSLPAGQAAFLPGKSYAASNPFYITIVGKGSHAAKPHLGIDAVAVAAQVINALHQYASRGVDPLDSVIISVSAIHSSSTLMNVLSGEVEMSGAIRTLGPVMRKKTVEAVRKIVDGIANAMGAKAEINIVEGHPGVVNDLTMTDFAEKTAKEVIGASNVIRLNQPTMGSEDFGLFQEHAPGCFYSMGVGNEDKGITAPWHNEMFDIEEDALPALSALHAAIAYDWLLENSGGEK